MTTVDLVVDDVSTTVVDVLVDDSSVVAVDVLVDGLEPEVIEVLVPALPGPIGPAGPNGPQGPPGQGVPAGGTVGQILAKATNSDFEASWQDNHMIYTGTDTPVTPQVGDIWVRPS